MIRRRNAQEMFETSVTHLLRQGHQAALPAQYDGPVCRYRAPGGDRCAVGCLITNKEYRAGMEGKRLGGVLNHYTLPEVFTQNFMLLDELQQVHDSHMEHGISSGIVDRWRGIAMKHDLNTDFLNTPEMKALIAQRDKEAREPKRRSARIR